MINKRFSLYEAYSFGFKTVMNHFGFFLAAMAIGSLASLIFLSFLGILDYWMFYEHFQTLIKTFTNAMNEATGAIHHAGTTVHDHVGSHLPAAVSKHISPRDVVSLDVSGQDIKSLLYRLLPSAIVFKLILDVISVGWTKMALDLQSNKSVNMEYLYQFYYLVPRVFIVSLIVGVLTIIGLLFFLVPGIFIYQRLRFARYFVIDKDQSIMQALESSWKMTDGSVIHLIGYSVLAALIASIGNVLWLLVFVVFPLSYQVDANVYRQMVKNK